jgi:hypothetical protein
MLTEVLCHNLPIFNDKSKNFKIGVLKESLKMFLPFKCKFAMPSIFDGNTKGP